MGAVANVLTITRVEMRRFFRDRGNYLFVFFLPLALIIFLGLQFGDMADTQLGVVTADDDAATQDLVDRLDAADGIAVVEVDDQDELLDLVSRANLTAGVVVPQAYGAALGAGEPTEVGFIGRPDPGATSLRALVEAAVADQAAPSGAAHAAAGLVDVPAGQLVDVARQVRTQLPQVSVTTTEVGADEAMAELAQLGQFDLGASGQLFLFVFLTSLAVSASLIQLRQWGIATRMLSTPTGLVTVLAGLAGGRFAIALFQAAYIVIISAVAFGVDWGDPVATSLLILLFCGVSAAAGMVLGALFRNEAQASGAGVGIALVFAALGGSMMALDYFPEGIMRQIALLTPHGWANTAMAEIVRRDGGVADVALELGVLAAMAIGLLALATWLLRRAITH
jgi:ABC-2 type transport system permease protein